MPQVQEPAASGIIFGKMEVKNTLIWVILPLYFAIFFLRMLRDSIKKAAALRLDS